MNKKLSVCLIILILAAFLCSPAYAGLGAIGSVFIINDPAQAVSGEEHDGALSNHLFHVGNYWYKMGLEFTGTYMFGYWFSTIDTNLDDWSISSALFVAYKPGAQADSRPMWASYNAIYDEDLGVFHCVFIYAGTTASEVRYNQATPLDNGTVLIGDFIGLIEGDSNGGNVAITLMDGKPIIASSFASTGGYSFDVSFADDSSGETWTINNHNIGSVSGTHVLPSIHAINSTHVYVFMWRTTIGDSKLYGFACDVNDSGISDFTEVTAENMEYDGIVNNGDRVTSPYSTVSVNIISPAEYAELIAILYINTTKSLKMIFWDPSSETISGDEEVIATITSALFPIQPLCAMSGNVIWAGYWDRNYGTSEQCIFYLHERSPGSGTWSSETAIDTGIWHVDILIPSCINKQPLDSKLIIVKQVSYIIYGRDVEISGMSITADIEIIGGAGADWVFTDWKFYRFNVTAEVEAENLSIRFIVPTGEENILCTFFTDGSTWIYSSNMTYESREGEPIRLKAGSWNLNRTAGITSATFDIWFESRILDVWSGGVDVYGSSDGIDWSFFENNLFRIYSKGGFEMNFASTGDAGKLAGGTPFSLYANNGSIVYNEIWYRDGQHIKLMPDIHFLTGLEPFYIRYGVDYSLGDGEWLHGWRIHINPKFVSYTGVFAANVWINMTNLWYGREYPTPSIYTKDLYMFYHGSVSGAGDPGHWKSWVDLWFSDKNASRVGAGRYNAYEFPMIDSADLWLRWLANNWGVKDNVFKEMSMQNPLLDTDNSTVISSEQIKMMRFWCELEVDDTDSGQHVSIENYEAFDVTRSRDLPLVGMSDPVFDETLLPTVGQRGILGALFTLFAGFGQWLSENVIFGGLNLWSTFVNFLDTIAAMFGAPKFFTNLFDWMAVLLGYLVDSAGYIGTMATSIFSLIGALLGHFLTIMAEIISTFVNTITMFTDMMAGGYGVGVDIWETFGISQWITVAIIFYPLYLIILWDQEGMDAVIKQLTMMFGILSWLFDFFVQLIQFTIRLITTVIESIPVAE